MIRYGFTKELEKPFEETVKKVSEEKKEGFGILTRIDVKEKFKEKLGIDFRKYLILGACHSPSAYEAILAEENIDLLLPCNVIIYEKESHCVVSLIKPTVAMGMIANNKLAQVAKKIEKKLVNVINVIDR